MTNDKKRIIADSELIINSDGSAFHIHLRPEHITDKIVICGDPGRVTMIASHFDTRDFEIQSREFHSIRGTYKGKDILCLSHGIGGDNIDIVMNELDALANIDFKTRTVKDEHRTLSIVLHYSSFRGVPSCNLAWTTWTFPCSTDSIFLLFN